MGLTGCGHPTHSNITSIAIEIEKRLVFVLPFARRTSHWPYTKVVTIADEVSGG